MGFNFKLHFREFALLFLTRILRMASNGIMAAMFFQILFFKLYSETGPGFIGLGLIFADILACLYLTFRADKIERIHTLMLASLLKLVTGLIYTESQN